MIKQFADEYGHQIDNWPDHAKAEYNQTTLPEMPQGLCSPSTVVAYKGETGSRVIVVCDSQTKTLYQLNPSTIELWDVVPATAIHRTGHSIIISLTPHMVALHLPTGEVYKDAPPPRVLRVKQKRQ